MIKKLREKRLGSRQIPLSHRSHIIGFQSLATGTVAHESALERDFVTLTSFTEPAAVITSQPVTIHFYDGAVRRRYTPDFLVTRGSKPSKLVEVKYQSDLRANDARLVPAFTSARAWADEQHTIFCIVTEREIRGPLLNNAKRLLPLRAAPLDIRTTMLALTATHSLENATFGAIVAALPDRQRALTTLWRLIARGVLRVDLSKAIALETTISFA
jgi:TnsA endonuclease N terminal